MRALPIFLGLLASVGLGQLAACGAFDGLCESTSTLSPGTFVIDKGNALAGIGPSPFQADQYLFTLPADFATVSEDFRLGGRHYLLTYRVTARSRH